MVVSETISSHGAGVDGMRRFSRLSLRLGVVVVLVAATLAALYGFAMISRGRRMVRDVSDRHVEALANAIRLHLLSEMEAGHQEDFNRLLARLSEPGGPKVRLLEGDGVVRFSHDAKEIGNRLPSVDDRRQAGQATYRERLEATGPCAGCHEAGAGLLGTLEIEVPLDWIQTGTAREIDLMVAAGGVAFFLLLLGALLALRHVFQRVEVLRGAVAHAATQGRLPVGTVWPRDEIGNVGESVDLVLAELGLARRRELEARRRHMRQLDQLALTGELAAGVAHEVKNPLGAIHVTLESLIRDESIADRKELLLRVQEKVEEIHSVMVGLLEFAKPRDVLLEVTDLAGCVDGVLDMMDGRLVKQGVRVRRHFAEALPRVLADERLLGQVLINLILNAMEARAEGLEIDIGIEVIQGNAPATEGEEVEPQARLWVQDNGPGIAARDVPRIFQPFYSSKGSGSGLGLAISRDIIHRHGGTLDLESRPGRPARFAIRIPVPDEAAIGATRDREGGGHGGSATQG